MMREIIKYRSQPRNTGAATTTFLLESPVMTYSTVVAAGVCNLIAAGCLLANTIIALSTVPASQMSLVPAETWVRSGCNLAGSGAAPSALFLVGSMWFTFSGTTRQITHSHLTVTHHTHTVGSHPLRFTRRTGSPTGAGRRIPGEDCNNARATTRCLCPPARPAVSHSLGQLSLLVRCALEQRHHCIQSAQQLLVLLCNHATEVAFAK
jgi:hypothetical protein